MRCTLFSVFVFGPSESSGFSSDAPARSGFQPDASLTPGLAFCVSWKGSVQRCGRLALGSLSLSDLEADVSTAPGKPYALAHGHDMSGFGLQPLRSCHSGSGRPTNVWCLLHFVGSLQLIVLQPFWVSLQFVAGVPSAAWSYSTHPMVWILASTAGFQSLQRSMAMC